MPDPTPSQSTPSTAARAASPASAGGRNATEEEKFQELVVETKDLCVKAMSQAQSEYNAASECLVRSPNAQLQEKLNQTFSAHQTANTQLKGGHFTDPSLLRLFNYGTALLYKNFNNCTKECELFDRTTQSQLLSQRTEQKIDGDGQ